MSNSITALKYRPNKIHPHLFALWIVFASIMMMFAGLTSAYIVRQAGGNWLEFGLPSLFFYNTIVVVLSSITLHASYISFKKQLTVPYRGLLVVTFFLGLLFLILQYLAWHQMFDAGVTLTENPAGSFVYVISGIHAAHILGGIAAIIVAMIHAFGLKHKATEKRKVRFQLVLHYWHFVGFLWLYLLTFFIVQQ